MVRAKFRCTDVKRVPSGHSEACAISLVPVYGNDNPEHENTKFFQATPSGQIQLNVVRVSAAEQFEPGREYYVDFTPAA